MEESPFDRARRRVGLVLGPLLLLAVFVLVPLEAFQSQAVRLLHEGASSHEVRALCVGARSMLAVLALVVTWWASEAIPIPITSLLPGLLLPLLQVVGADDGQLFDYRSTRALTGYAHPVIFLFIGSFLLAGAFQKWGLDRRVSLLILTQGRLAEHPSTIVLAFMATAALCSMWITNTATTAMMLPLILGVMTRAGCAVGGTSNLGTALLLGTAFAASIGGMATPVGTAPNALVLSNLDKAGLSRIGFLQWMCFGIPVVLVMVPITWWLLMRLFPLEVETIAGGKQALVDERSSLGPLGPGERGTLVVFIIVMTMWISRSILPGVFKSLLPWIDDYLIGLLAGILLFLFPAGEGKTLLSWKDSTSIDWGTLLLFGGGIALSDAMFHTGTARWVAEGFLELVGGAPSTILLISMFVLMIDLITEVTSNTAVSATMIPIAITVFQEAGRDPTLAALACGLAASLAFALPVATPPNAIVYGSGHVKMTSMVKAGLCLDILGAVCVTAGLYLVAGQALGIVRF